MSLQEWVEYRFVKGRGKGSHRLRIKNINKGRKAAPYETQNME